MSNPAKEILVIGLGLIGSSLAKAAKNKGLVVHGFDEDKNSLEEALNKNIIDSSFESLKDIKFPCDGMHSIPKSVSSLNKNSR